MEVDLSKPAFGPDAQKISDLGKPAEESQPEEAKVVESAESKESAPEPVESVEETEEEQKVPYSRFKKFHDRALEAEQEAAEWRAKAESVTSRAPHSQQEQETGEVPSYWQELYGDSDASKRAWKIQEQANQRVIEEAQQKAIEAVESRESKEAERISQNEEVIDRNLDNLADYAGHRLSEKEQSAILDIVDEFTPKDQDGRYLGATIPFEKAWDIYELKTQAQKAPKTEARNKVAALTGSPSSGEPSVNEKDKSFNPLDWNAYKRRM